MSQVLSSSLLNGVNISQVADYIRWPVTETLPITHRKVPITCSLAFYAPV